VKKQEESIPILNNDNNNVVRDEKKAHLLNNFFSKHWNYAEPSLSEVYILHQKVFRMKAALMLTFERVECFKGLFSPLTCCG